MSRPVTAYLVHLARTGETRTRQEIADDLGVTYRAATVAVQRVEDRSLVDQVVVERTHAARVHRLLVEYAEDGVTISGRDLADEAQTSRATVYKVLADLRDSGEGDVVERAISPHYKERRPKPVDVDADPAKTATLAPDAKGLLRHVDDELAAIARDRLDGRRLVLRISSLRALLSDAL